MGAPWPGRPPRLAVLALVVLLGAGAACSSDEPDDAGSPRVPADRPAGDPSPSTSSAPPSSEATTTTADPALAAAFADLEATYAARLGVYALDTGTGATIEHRADERFAYASTHKALSAALVLQATEPADLDEVVRYSAGDVVGHSPVTELHVETGLPLGEVIRAAITLSDNTAANLLLERLGGPAGFEAGLRALGDDTTSADRWEPGLSDWAPGETRDTSTPRAMAANLERCVLGDALDAVDRQVLVDALRANTTGDELIRAAVPEGWVVGDKTGTASHGGRNDIAVIEPPGGDPIVLAVYSNRLDPDAEPDAALVAAAAGVVLQSLVA